MSMSMSMLLLFEAEVDESVQEGVVLVFDNEEGNEEEVDEGGRVLAAAAARWSEVEGTTDMAGWQVQLACGNRTVGQSKT